MSGILSDPSVRWVEIGGKRVWTKADVNGWQDIETAPKDGTIILGCEWHDGKHIVVEVVWAVSRWHLASTVWSDESYYAEPTHWMPRPGPPQE